eukprot:evm.model.NODE_27316_length_40306_cov_21.155485.11
MDKNTAIAIRTGASHDPGQTGEDAELALVGDAATLLHLLQTQAAQLGGGVGKRAGSTIPATRPVSTHLRLAVTLNDGG